MLGLDGILVCFCCSSLNWSPIEPSDINKTWLLQVSGGNSSVPRIRVRNIELVFLFLNQQICCVYSKNRLDDMVLLSIQSTCLN